MRLTAIASAAALNKVTTFRILVGLSDRLRERESMLIAALRRNAQMVARAAQEPLETGAGGPTLVRAGR
jgi:hypothetical protein